MDNTALYKGAGIWSITSNNLTLISNTIADNHCTESSSYSYGGGLAISDSGSAVGKNNIFYGNTCNTSPNIYGRPSFTYTCVGNQILPGTGNIMGNPLFATGSSGDFYLSQIAAGQAQNSPCVDTGDPISTMITGTTRTDQVQDAGIVDMGYHYRIIATLPPPVTIRLSPVNPPITIPASGGSFDFNASVMNTGSSPASFDAWIMVQLPTQAWYGPVLGPLNLTLSGGMTVSRLRTQAVPGSAPAGMYTYRGYIGLYSNTKWDSSNFTFTKISAGDGSWVNDWARTGESFEGEILAQTTSIFEFKGASPNPFNLCTTIKYDLPAATRATLSVFDIKGRLVSDLVNGWHEAGTHEVNFDASSLSSGIYICCLEAGGWSAAQKLVLIK